MIQVLLRLLAQALSKSAGRQRLCILTYHRVLPTPDVLRPAEPDAAKFAEQLQLLVRTFNILRLDRAVSLLAADQLPPRALSVTFDDGYRDNFDVALPILRRFEVPATFFVASGFMAGGAMFNDTIIEAIRTAKRQSFALPWAEQQTVQIGSIAEKLQAIDSLLPVVKKIPLVERARVVQELAQRMDADPPSQLMMSAEQVKSLHEQGMEVGAHTLHHPILSSLPDTEAQHEIAASKQQLEALLGVPVTGFAYPNGRPGRDYAPVHAAMVQQAGFAYAVSTRWATADAASPLYELPRVAPWGDSALMFAARAAHSYRDR